MFEKSAGILRTLLIEGLARVAPSAHPLKKGADVFAYLLENLPKYQSAFPGAFGLEALSSADRAEWENRINSAKGNPLCNPADSPEFAAFRKLGFAVEDGGRGHITIDYGAVLKTGLKGIYDTLDLSCDFDCAVGDTLLAAKKFAEFYHCRVPWESPCDFDEALRGVWLLYECLVLSEHVSWSYSWGRMDQYLLPYAEGMNQSELKEKFVAFFRLLNEAAFQDNACALNVGGPEGFNKVSYAIIEAAAEVHLPAPLLAVRVSKGLPDKDFELLFRKELLTCGQPTFYGEESCRNALLRRGVAPADAEHWAVNSCMGLIVAGKEWQDMWGAILPMTTALELALNGGDFFRLPMPLPCRVPGKSLDDYPDYASLYSQILQYVRFFFDIFVAEDKRRCAANMQTQQNAFAPAFYDNCLARKKEMRDGGVKYRTMIVETMGTANLADSLFAIRELVFRCKKYTLADFRDALKNNFAGAEELRSEILKLPKYTQNHAEVNDLMRQLTGDVAGIAERFSGGGFFCTPSLHTLDRHIQTGSCVEATADGRLAHEPLAKNAGSGREVRAAYTDRILAASSWDQSRFSGGQPLDLWIDPAEWENPEARHAYTRLFRTYLENGGLQLQVNGADPEMLKDAMEHPEQYPDLSVRIGGFSVRFVKLSPRGQLDFIRRFSLGI